MRNSIVGGRVGEFIEANESVKRLFHSSLRRTGSVGTATVYAKGLMYFIEYLDYPSADQLLRDIYNIDLNLKIEDFINYLLYDKGTCRSTVNLYVAAIKKWLKVNRVGVKVDVERPQVWTVERDRIPSKEELRTILRHASLEDRALILITLSSGLRRSTLAALKLKNIDLNNEIPVIKVTPEIAKERPDRGYITFITPEAKEALLAYLRERERMGEKLTPDSPVISGRPLGVHLNPNSITTKWDRLLNLANLNMKTEKVRDRIGVEYGGKRYKIRFHSLRKYFKTWMTLSGVPSEIVEFMMGHRAGINQVYLLTGIEDAFNPILIDKLREYYKRAIPNLTILDVSVEQLKKLEEELDKLRARYDEHSRLLERLAKKFRELEKLIMEEVQGDL